MKRLFLLGPLEHMNAIHWKRETNEVSPTIASVFDWRHFPKQSTVKMNPRTTLWSFWIEKGTDYIKAYLAGTSIVEYQQEKIWQNLAPEIDMRFAETLLSTDWSRAPWNSIRLVSFVPGSIKVSNSQILHIAVRIKVPTTQIQEISWSIHGILQKSQNLYASIIVLNQL